jgi:hypothetical protein
VTAARTGLVHLEDLSDEDLTKLDEEFKKLNDKLDEKLRKIETKSKL